MGCLDPSSQSFSMKENAPVKTASNVLLGLGMVLITAYLIIGIRAGADFVHSPFVMLPGGLLCAAGGIVGRWILPRL